MFRSILVERETVPWQLADDWLYLAKCKQLGPLISLAAVIQKIPGFMTLHAVLYIF
jgi:hypothetical protein